MDYYSKQISKLIEELSSLPGIGSKSAQRLAFHILNMPMEQAEGLSRAITEARRNVRYCKTCYTLTDHELCPICKNTGRDHKTIMVVEDTRDLAAYEKTQKYTGVYHVLHGAISPKLELVAMITSSTSSCSRCISSFSLMSPGPIPSMGEIAPWSTWYTPVYFWVFS